MHSLRDPGGQIVTEQDDDVVITPDHRLVGCRGRALVAVLIVTALVLVLVAFLVMSLLSG